MTSTRESKEPEAIAGVQVLLRPHKNPVNAIPLVKWLQHPVHDLAWLQVHHQAELVKVLVVVPDPTIYPALLSELCQQTCSGAKVSWRGQVYEVMGVEVDSDALHIVQIPITPTRSLPLNWGQAVHAQLFRWLAAADPGLASELHQQQDLPATVGLRATSANRLYLRISLLQPTLLAPLLWGMSRDLGHSLTWAQVPCRLGTNVEIQGANFEALMGASSKTIQLEFLSPTSFKQAGNIQPFPLPELVFGSLWRRWQTFAPQHLQLPAFDWIGWVSAYNLQTEVVKLKGGIEIGAQGWANYQLSNVEQTQAATTLSRFAQFAGIGRKTTMGMGQAQLVVSSKSVLASRPDLSS